MAKPDIISRFAVDVSAALCRLHVPAGALARLRTGDSIQVLYRADAAPTVELQVDGKAFAQAEIIEHEGRICARILRLSTESEYKAYQEWRLTKAEAKKA